VEVIHAEDVHRHYQDHPQNLRELLFSLYDLFEQRRLAAGSRAESA
jgi:hypothetical protein